MKFIEPETETALNAFWLKSDEAKELSDFMLAELRAEGSIIAMVCDTAGPNGERTNEHSDKAGA